MFEPNPNNLLYILPVLAVLLVLNWIVRWVWHLTHREYKRRPSFSECFGRMWYTFLGTFESLIKWKDCTGDDRDNIWDTTGVVAAIVILALLLTGLIFSVIILAAA